MKKPESHIKLKGNNKQGTRADKVDNSAQLTIGVLNSLHSQIALISETGEVVFANRAWNEFGEKFPDYNLPRVPVGYKIFIPYLYKGDIEFNDYTEIIHGINSVIEKKVASFVKIFRTQMEHTRFWFQLNITSFPDSDNKIVLRYVDLTQRIEQEMLVQSQEIKFRSLVENISDIVITVAPDLRIQFASTSFCHVFGKSSTETVGLKLPDLLSLETWEIFEKVMHDANQNPGKKVHYNFIISEVRNYARHFDAVLEWIISDNGCYYLISAHDVTGRQLIEQELNNKIRELAQSNEELEQFAYIASHDLQEPLRMITSFLSQLENKYIEHLDDRAKKYISFCTDGATRMRQMILDLLSYSRIGNDMIKLEPVCMNDLVREVLLANHMAIKERGITVLLNPLSVIDANKSMLYSLVHNLISNAIKYSSPEREGIIRIYQEKMGEGITFTIEDNGIGIEAKYFNKIFTIFQRLHTREEYSGNGIGLSVCKKIVEKHKGRIWIESEYGVGSKFKFFLPV